jgi:predicted amidohydrolase
MIKISVLQFNPEFGAFDKNILKVRALLKSLKTDVLVLPELCTSGYSFLNRKESLPFAEKYQDLSLRFFQEIARDTHSMVIAGFPEISGSQVFNSSLVVMPGGDFKIYRKSHLFFKEKECFDPGDSGFFVVQHPSLDCRVGIMICNDWRYPEAARSLALLGADLIACPSNLVSEVWKIGMASRALENKLYLAVANRYGTEIRNLGKEGNQTLVFTGDSVIYDYNGKPRVEASRTGDALIYLEIDPILCRNKAFNPYNDLLRDRRPELYVH